MAKLCVPTLRSIGLGAAFLATINTGVLASYPAPSSACSSASSTIWEIKNFTVDTNSKFYYGLGTVGKASFLIKNSANGYEFACTQGSGRDIPSPNFSVKDGKVWYSCNAYCYGLDTNPPLDTSFSFDMESKMLSVNQKWSCTGNGSSSA